MVSSTVLPKVEEGRGKRGESEKKRLRRKRVERYKRMIAKKVGKRRKRGEKRLIQGRELFRTTMMNL